MMATKFFILMSFVIFTSIPFELFSQCGCIGGAAIGGLTSVGGTANSGVLREGYLRANLFYRFSYGSQFFSKDSKISRPDDLLANNYKIQFTNLSLGYGFSNKLTAELELLYFPEKSQVYGSELQNNYEKIQSKGFSHLVLTGKYNVFSSLVNEFEFTTGAGVKIPFKLEQGDYWQYVESSTADFGLSLHSFLHKGFKEIGLGVFLLNKADINFENKSKNQYGNAIYSSLFFTKILYENLSGLLELRNEFRGQDKIREQDSLTAHINHDSGGKFLFLSPQVNYSISGLNFSLYYDYPVYQYYYGRQLGNKYSFGFNITWQTKL